MFFLPHCPSVIFATGFGQADETPGHFSIALKKGSLFGE